MKTELERLIELQKTDTRIRQLKQSIDTADQKRADIEQEFERHASSIREIQNRRDEARAVRADLEAKIADNQTYLDRADRNLKTAQDQKQYETAMREMDALQKQIAALETQALEQMTEIEESEKLLAERADEINSLEGNRAAALKVFDSALKKNRAELEVNNTKRAEVFATIPPRKAAIYNRFAQRSRDGIAVAEVINGACSACNMSLRKQVQQELNMTDQILTCENCARILYLTPVETDEAKAANQES